jgi:Fur family transcriptional regulator, ferric uptake regulator
MKNTIIKHNCSEELKNADLKITPARLGVLEALENSNTPLDTATLISYLEQHKIKADKVTVFRILNTLTEKGIAKSIELNEGKKRFEYAGNSEHHHFVCDNCGIIEDVSDCNLEILEKTITEKKGLLIKRHSLEFFGLCPTCQR